MKKLVVITLWACSPVLFTVVGLPINDSRRLEADRTG